MRKRFILALSCVALVIIVVLFGWHYRRHNTNSKPTIIKTQDTVSGKPNNDTTTTPPSNSEKTSVGGGVVAPATGSGVTILGPSGSFISNHSPNLNGSPAPSAEESVCNGTPGAKCYIQFTNSEDGVVFKLPEKSLDINGAAYWQWDVKNNNLKQGVWHIVAFSTLGDQIKSTQDARDLTVNP